jgi:hypothetical protein
VDRLAGRTPVREGRPRRRDRRGRAVGASVDVRRARPAAATAPRWGEGVQLRRTRRAERPRTPPASRARTREQHVEPPSEHALTIGGRTDRDVRAIGCRSAPRLPSRRP